ncbi:MAG: hypothetical protein IMZ54_11730 [Acidobacteria bacterium]|nr:hypothetical protein [Acidobacteriota bacterium]
MALGAKALVTWDDAAAFIKPADSDVPVVEAIVDGVSEYFNRRTRRTLRQMTYTALYLNGNGQTDFWLPNAPVIITVPLPLTLAVGSPTPLALVINTDFYVDQDNGRLIRVSGEWDKGFRNILTTHTAGWTEALMPRDLRLACLEQSALQYQRWLSKSWATQSTSMGGSSISVSDEHLIKGLDKILDLYVRIPS